MPCLTRVIPDLQRNGPLLEIYFSVPEKLEKELVSNKKKVPDPVKCDALIDTGASNCVIQQDIPKKLGLSPVGEIAMTTPSCQSCKCYTYYLRMTILPQNIVYEGVFTAAPLMGQQIDCLVGRDLLSTCVLIYNGYMKQFTFSL